MPAFHLAVGRDGLAALTFDLPESRINLFNRQVAEELAEHIGELAKRRDVGCLVLLSAKEGSFCHGMDVDLLDAVAEPEQAQAAASRGQQLLTAWADLPFPTIAAIQGTCMGGGTELALASTFRVMSNHPALRIGLPEVQLGVVPGWGGCVRLPRRIGIQDALEVILGGRGLPGWRALKLGLIDALLPDEGFLHHVRDFALHQIEGQRPTPDHELKELLLERNPLGRKILFDQARKRTLNRTRSHYPAALRAIEVVRVGIERGPEAGFEAEARAVAELATSPVCKNLIHVFKLTQSSRRRGRQELPAESEPPLKRVAVVGAGVMGGGIAQLMAERAAIPVRLKDVAPQALTACLQRCHRQLHNKLQRRRLTPQQVRGTLALLQPCLDYSGFEHAELVLEAVTEDLATKRQVFTELAKVVPPDTVLASNTASLPIKELRRDLPHPERVLGLHFFHPVQRMPLVEVVTTADTSPAAVATAVAFIQRLGKTAIPVNDQPGFLVNRLLTFYVVEALWLLAEGHDMDALERVMVDWGLPMGPFALLDEIGIDIATEVAAILADTFGPRLPLPNREWPQRLLEQGHLGAKVGRGFYRYEGGQRRHPDHDVYRLLRVQAPHRTTDPVHAADRMVLPMVNEAARCLEEGVVREPSQIDLALILGAGFPAFRGGLCRWADQQGLAEIIHLLERLSATAGERFTPSPALLAIARRGGFYSA